MRVGEIRQFCKLKDEGQSLMRVAMIRKNWTVANDRPVFSSIQLIVCSGHCFVKYFRLSHGGREDEENRVDENAKHSGGGNRW